MAEGPPRYTILPVDSIMSLTPELSNYHAPLFITFDKQKPKNEFCCVAVLGKSHSHTIKTNCQHLHCRLSVSHNKASLIQKFIGPVSVNDLDL